MTCPELSRITSVVIATCKNQSGHNCQHNNLLQKKRGCKALLNRHTFQDPGLFDDHDHQDGLCVPFFHGDAYCGDPSPCPCRDPSHCPCRDPCLFHDLCHGLCGDPCLCPFLYLCLYPWILPTPHHVNVCLPRYKCKVEHYFEHTNTKEKKSKRKIAFSR
jgi:hypothetical protein